MFEMSDDTPRGTGSLPPSPVETAFDDMRHQAVAAELGRYRQISRLLKAQIEGSIDQTSTSALALIVGLDALDRLVAGLLAEVSGSEEESLEIISGGERAVSANAALVENLQTIILERSQDAADDRAVYEDISQQTAAFATALDSITRIASETRFLAFNAAVLAAQAGPAGKGFAVLASEIRTLSDEATGVSSDVREGLHRLRETTGRRLKQKADAVDEIDLLRSLTIHSEAARESFTRLAQHQRATLETFQTNATAVGRDVMDLMGKTQFQDIVSQRLSGVEKGLDGLADHADALADVLRGGGGVVPDAETSIVGSLRSSYVMAGQLAADREVTGSGDEPTGHSEPSSVELF